MYLLLKMVIFQCHVSFQGSIFPRIHLLAHLRSPGLKVKLLVGHLGHLEGEQPYLGDLLTMVINHLLTGMILQVRCAKFLG